MRRRDPATTGEAYQRFSGITHFVEAVEPPVGRFSVTNQRIPIDFLHESVSSDTLVVFFHGAVKKDQVGPWFVGNGIMKGLHANWLAVSDPTLYLDAELTLGWFIGSRRQNDVQGLIRRTIQHLARISGVKHLIFVGGSGGGFAALDMSRRFPGSLALPMNPQTSIRWHRPVTVAKYLHAAWGWKVDYPDKLPERAVHDQVAAYKTEQSNTVGYIQNTRDQRHIDDHMIPFMRVAGERPDTWLLMDSWGDVEGETHVAPPKPVIREILSAAGTSQGDWSQALHTSGFARPDCTTY